MERTTARLGILTATLLALAVPAAPQAVCACDDEHAQVLVVSAADATPAPEATPPPARPPQGPRAPHAPRAATTTVTPSVPYPAPAPAEAPEAAELPDVPQAPSLVTPRGWFGFGIDCEFRARRATSDSAAVWWFKTLPRVYSVDLGSPAARAGLRRGDVLTRIDGASILSADGGRRFGSIKPGQSVRWTVLRDGTQREVIAQAAERPERRASVALLDLRGELSRLNDLKDMEQLRREIGQLNREMERVRIRDEARSRVDVQTYTVRRLRYAGVLNGAEIEVRGPGSVIVSEVPGKNEMIITVGESIVRIRVPDTLPAKTPEGPR